MTRFAEPLVAVHGGAGKRRRAAPAEEAEARRALGEALDVAIGRLRKGGSALDAVVEAVVILEDHPLFNAGRGSALTAKGRVEMDAAVMDGATRAAGGVASVRTVQNPVRLARLVLERTPHVLLAGAGAEAFARAQGLPRVDPSWFVVPCAAQAPPPRAAPCAQERPSSPRHRRRGCARRSGPPGRRHLDRRRREPAPGPHRRQPDRRCGHLGR